MDYLGFLRTSDCATATVKAGKRSEKAIAKQSDAVITYQSCRLAHFFTTDHAFKESYAVPIVLSSYSQNESGLAQPQQRFGQQN